jgi:hypothetical protein
MRYTGRCHCGAVRFAFDSEPITTGCRCNCSICIRKGAVLSSQWVDGVEVEGLDAAAIYLWGDRDVSHHFCTTCGIFPFSTLTTAPSKYRVNLGCVDGIDALALEISILDGRSL